MRRIVVSLGLLLTACPADDPSTGETSTLSTSASGTTGETAETDECTPGTEGCPCIDGQCLAGLQCLSDLCVEDLPDPDPSETTTGLPETTGASETTDGLPECSGVLAFCEAPDVCWNSECVDQTNFSFEITLWSWDPAASCADLDVDATPELYASLDVGGELVGSTDIRSTCPAEFEHVFCLSPEEMKLSFELRLLEADDVSANDLVHRFCWASEENPNLCGRIPEAWITEGAFNEPGSWGTLHLEFRPVESCG